MDQLTRDALFPATLTHAEIRRVIVGIMLAMLLAALDQTVVATALPTIGRELGDVEHTAWVVTSYLLTATAVTPLYGKLADIHGRRVTLLVAIGVFVLGSAACALSGSMLTLVLARALQGLGGGGLIALAQTIIGDIVAPRERGRYQAYIAAVFTTSSLVGPALGGLIAERLHWSFIFWINLPLGLLALLMTERALRRLPRVERPHQLDLPGAALLVLATVLALLALSWGGTRYPWESAPILGLALGAVLVGLLFAWRIRTAAEPFIPVSLFREPVVRWGTLAATFTMGTYIALTVTLPVYFESAQGLSATGSGLALIPLMLGTVAGSTAAGQIMGRFKHYRRPAVAGLAAGALGMAWLAWRAPVAGLWEVGILLGLLSLGLGLGLPVTTVSVQNAVAPHQLGTATGAMNFSRSLGGAFLVTLFSTLVLAGAAAGAHPESLSGAGLVAEVAAQRFRWVFAAASLTFTLALLALLRMEERPLRSGVPRSAAAE